MSNSPYADLDRPPLHERALNRRLVRPGSLWHEIRVVPETGSTNADLAAEARAGAAEGLVLVAEVQNAGRGRLGRAWTAPPRSGLMFSMLLRPQVNPSLLGWLPLLAGTAVAGAVRKITARAGAGDFDTDAASRDGEPGEAGPGSGRGGVDVRLKWPNDLLVGERKLGGILAERVGDAVIIGIGLNVGLRAAELPVPTATSLAIEEAAFTDREPLLRAVLRQIEVAYRDWARLNGDPDASGLGQAYRGLCATLDRAVRAQLPGDQVVTGTATGIDPAGCLVIETESGDQIVSAGDVVHVR